MLVAVLAVCSLLLLIGISVVRLVNDGINVQRDVREQQLISTTYLSTMSILRDRTICEANFKDVAITAAPSERLNLVTSPGKVLFSKGDKIEVIRIEAVTLRDYQPYGLTGTDPLKGVLDLQILFGSSLGKGITRPRHILLAVELNAYPPAAAGAPNGIKTCVAIGGEDGIWQRAANGDIYYSAGPVGVGNDSPPSTTKLQVANALLATDFFHPSDERLKKDIRRVEGLDAIEKLRGVAFDWRDGSGSAHGVLAQNIEQVFPEAVHTEANGVKRVEYDQLIGPLVESVKDLSRKNRVLRERVKRLQH